MKTIRKPKKNQKRKRFNLRLQEDEYREFNKLVVAEGESVSEALRRLISEEIKKYNKLLSVG